MANFSYFNQNSPRFSGIAEPHGGCFSQYNNNNNNINYFNNQPSFSMQNSFSRENQAWQKPYFSNELRQTNYQESSIQYKRGFQSESSPFSQRRTNFPRHAWARKNQLTNANPVKGGMGMYLLKKMGWRPGEGLGKNRGGQLEPLKMNIKMDKKGLLSAGEVAPKRPVVKCSGKHPVSFLMELCSHSKWDPPHYTLVFESGPVHRKNFLFKVRVNGKDYQPSHVCSIKKQAKAQAAIICLQSLGLLPKDIKTVL